MALQYEKAEIISLRGHPEWNERFIQNTIAEDPSILGLGDLMLRDKERSQPTRGRLDLLLQTEDRQSWFEVEIQLGPTDEAHIIRTIEYWDVERKRYPEINHTAVIIAEEITGRFFNVISLFNQAIPLVAVKVSALTIGAKATLVFTKVLDYLPKGIEEADESTQIVDKGTWEKRSTPEALVYVDSLLKETRAVDPSVQLKYNQSYIGIQVSSETSNFATFRPQNRALRIHVHIAASKELEDELDSRNVDWVYENSRYKYYRLRIPINDFAAQASFLSGLLLRAYREVERTPNLS
jgi:predicted transport protein